ncbi:MAG: hypothetical protein AB7Q17_11790 [Phycisphaerae bacterium]
MRPILAATLVLSLVVFAGCPLSTGLPDELDVVLPQNQKQTAAADTGPQSLGGATWAIFRKFDPNAPDDPQSVAPAPGPYGGLLNGGLLERPPVDGLIFRVDVAASGRITRVRDNQFFLADIYGADLEITADRQPTTLPGITYRSASYGVTVGDQIGLAAYVEVDFLGLRVGNAVLYAWGTLADGRVDGTFGYLLNFDGGLGDLLLDTTGDQYLFYATRE